MKGLLLILFFGMIMASSASASTMVQNNTFCSSLTEKTKHTFKQEIFCDYAKNSSNVTISAKSFFSSSGGGGGSGSGFYCEEGYLFNASTGRCHPVLIENIMVLKESAPIQHNGGFELLLAKTIVVILVIILIGVLVSLPLRKKLRGKVD